MNLKMANETNEKTNIQVTEMNNITDETENKKTDAERIMDADDAAIDTAIKQFDRVNARVAVKPWNVAGKSDALVGPGTSAMTPGAMQMSATVKLHSRLSINLFRGRKGDPANNVRPIIGLARFARQAAMVWSAASLDDPFADQTFVDIEQAYEVAKTTITGKMESMKRLLDGLDDFEITLQASVQPVNLELNFFSPWGFRGATLLNQFDKLVRMALTARHLGIFTEGDWESIIHESQRAMRHMFVEVDSWVATGVKRIDMRTDSKLAKRAKQKYVELKKSYFMVDDAVMSGKYRATLSPVNRILETYLADTGKENHTLVMGTTRAGKSRHTSLVNAQESAVIEVDGTVEIAVDESEKKRIDATHTVMKANRAAKKPTFGFVIPTSGVKAASGAGRADVERGE